MARRIYAGIGSRETPPHIQQTMTDCATVLARNGWVLRSGGAEGADIAFEKGCVLGSGVRNIFLPWALFRGSQSELHHVCQGAMHIAESIHPAWENCSPAARKLHARNVYQILGQSLREPTHCVVCWTPWGRVQGGTATALRLAEKHLIPVINLGEPEWQKYSGAEIAEFVWLFANETGIA